MAACAGMLALRLTFPMMVELAEAQAKTTDVAEIFSGVGSVWKAGLLMGYNSEGFDKVMDDDMNVFHAKGLEEVVKLVGRLKPGSLLWISPDCSSFCGLCVAQTERSLQNPSGNASRDCVRDGNYMAMVSVMLFVLGWMLGAHPFLENPAGNWIWKLPAVQQVFEQIAVHKASLRRCRFSRGFRPKKAYGLAGPAPWMHLLNFPSNHIQPHQKLADVVVKNGKVQVNGKQKALKSSASYPVKMGQKVIEIWQQNGAANLVPSSSSGINHDADEMTGSSQSWKHCMEDSPVWVRCQKKSRADSSWKLCQDELQASTSSWKTCLE